MLSCDRRPQNLTLIILAVTVGILYLAFYRNSFGIYNDVKSNVPNVQIPKSEKDTKPGSLDKKTQIECRGKRQKIIKNIFSRDQKGWYENRDVCDACFDFPKATLKTNYGNTPIFIYPRDQDIWVSTSLQDRGTFESEKMMVISDMMKKDPTLNIIDIGANVGVYTLNAAKAGRKVLAVEALDKNLQHVCASVMEGGLQDNVYLIHNAISNGNIMVNLGVDKKNMGGTFVDVDSDHIKKLKEGRAQGNYGQVYTITMDNLLELPFINQFQKVFIKMDIEGFEARAVEKATKFFEKINVVGFVMEWEFHKNQPTAKKIIDFMTARKFKPHACSIAKTPLNVANYNKWGYDVLWLPS